jgi:hypothetical protein
MGNMARQSSERVRSRARVEELNDGDGGSGANGKFWQSFGVNLERLKDLANLGKEAEYI